ncbi:hypothetical protein EVAR_47903_1 [Eumeta japonica]|uniref:Uncharacterized protein n=1 Tax=Eumeta variegata TaxID=151549 RepID=A0A4C1YBT3_EUMVA|nr:hypothetical protein EVAR_47903_1 [Eumeta japonica]
MAPSPNYAGVGAEQANFNGRVFVRLHKSFKTPWRDFATSGSEPSICSALPKFLQKTRRGKNFGTTQYKMSKSRIYLDIRYTVFHLISLAVKQIEYLYMKYTGMWSFTVAVQPIHEQPSVSSVCVGEGQGSLSAEVLIPTLMWGSGGWVWQRKNESRINAVEMRSLRTRSPGFPVFSSGSHIVPDFNPGAVFYVAFNFDTDICNDFGLNENEANSGVKNKIRVTFLGGSVLV